MFKCLYFKNTLMRTDVINQLRLFSQTLAQNVKSKHPTFSKSYHCSPNRAFKIKNTRNSIEKATSETLDTNTNVLNNVLLYKHENDIFILGMKIFAFGWLFCSGVIAYYSYTPKFITLWSTSSTFKDYLKGCGIRIAYFIYGIITGPVCLLLINFVTQRFVKYVILHKGGNEVSIIANHIFQNELIVTVPVNQVSANIRRCEMKGHLPLKIKGQRFFYLLDRQGKFLNETLFDNTVGAARTWK